MGTCAPPDPVHPSWSCPHGTVVWPASLTSLTSLTCRACYQSICSPAYSEAAAGVGSQFWVAELLTSSPSMPGAAVGPSGSDRSSSSPMPDSAFAASSSLLQAPMVIGCVGLQRKHVGETSDAGLLDGFELRRMFVDPLFRRQGVAAALLQTLIEHAKMADPAALAIMLTTSSAQVSICFTSQVGLALYIICWLPFCQQMVLCGVAWLISHVNSEGRVPINV